MRVTTTIIAAACVLAMTGCSSSDQTSTASTDAAPGPAAQLECTKLTKTELSSIAEGLLDSKIKLTAGWRAPLPADVQGGGLEQLVVVTMKGAGIDNEPALLAIGEQVGPVMAVDHVAREFFDWGAAADEGSKMASIRDAIAVSDTAAQMPSCLS